MNNTVQINAADEGAFIVMRVTGSADRFGRTCMQVDHPTAGFRIFESGAQARAAAYSMAEKEPGVKFVVMRAMCGIDAPKPVPRKTEF
ncbi:hypothetical protein UFOVP347_8 [uncultured Caudovirales phage]|uniref:Uncharacterized protein n=1 Tax=uncultured Caudovirales phage TaxID=2100421 RepID=A0A6J5M619_9CAUD|nr:hypothetical protein UFOVP347_8 [uncultured Caudovirales phage]